MRRRFARRFSVAMECVPEVGVRPAVVLIKGKFKCSFGAWQGQGWLWKCPNLNLVSRVGAPREKISSQDSKAAGRQGPSTGGATTCLPCDFQFNRFYRRHTHLEFFSEGIEPFSPRAISADPISSIFRVGAPMVLEHGVKDVLSFREVHGKL